MTTEKTTKKKVVPRKKKAKSKTLKLPPPSMKMSAIDIDGDDDTLCFNIWDGDKLLGQVEGTVCELHRTALVAQGDASTNGKDYIPIFADALTAKYGVKVNEVSAYKMANEIFMRFGEQKKSTNG